MDSTRVSLDLMRASLDLDPLYRILRDMELESVTSGSDLGHLYELLRMLESLEKCLNAYMKSISSCFERDERGHTVFTEFLRKKLIALRSFKKTLRDKHSSLRQHINRCSRSHLRALTILNLPDEILIMISEKVSDDSDDSDKTLNIKNLRLTCWRLCNVSSHLLTNYIEVGISNDSLSVLEQVSHHPTISKGICTVRINLDFYSAELAENFEKYATYNAGRLQRTTSFDMTGLISAVAQRASFEVELREHSFIDGVTVSERSPPPLKVLKAKLRSAQAVLDSWKTLLNGQPELALCKRDVIRRKILQEGYEEYQRRFADQKILLESGRFMDTIAAIMARMPGAKRLELVNGNSDLYERAGLLRDYELVCVGDYHMHDMISKAILAPHTWEDARLHGLGQPPPGLLAGPILAINRAGVVLKDIAIRLTLPDDISFITSISEEDLERLTAAVQNLSIQHCTLDLILDRRETQDNWNTHLQRLICALLDAESITDIDFSFGFSNLSISQYNSFNIGSIINSRPRPNLLRSEWRGVSLDSTDLERFASQQNPKMERFSMDCVHLLSGTWADVLDIFRDSLTHAEVRNPLGAEALFTEHDSIDIFREWRYSLAQSYVRGWTSQNPLRVLSDGESDGESDWESDWESDGVSDGGSDGVSDGEAEASDTE